MTATNLTCTIENYHRSPAIGCSMLKAFGDHPKLYQGRYVTQEAAPFTGNTSTEFGNRVDAWLLERERCVTIPGDVLGKNNAKNTKAYRAWRDEHADYVHFTAKDLAICERIEANVREHPLAAGLIFGEGESQVSVFWQNDLGQELKCRFDRVTPAAWVDLKTAVSVKERKFRNQIEEYQYHWQAVHYTEGGLAWSGEGKPFLFVCVRNSEPYEVAVYKLKDRWLERGAKERREILEKIQTATAVDYWLPPGYDKCVELDQPEWTDNK